MPRRPLGLYRRRGSLGPCRAITVRIPVDLAQQLDQRAKASCTSKTVLVERGLRSIFCQKPEAMLAQLVEQGSEHLAIARQLVAAAERQADAAEAAARL